MKRIVSVFIIIVFGIMIVGFTSPDYMKYKFNTYKVKTSLLQGNVFDSSNNKIYFDSSKTYTSILVNFAGPCNKA